MNLLKTVLVFSLFVSASLLEFAELRAENERLKAQIERLERDTQLIHEFEITAYTAGYESTGKRPGDPDYGITASGAPVKVGYTVACPPSMAFGTRLEIEGLGVRVCEDRGAAITEGRLDVYMLRLEDALEFGRQTRKVRILKGCE